MDAAVLEQRALLLKLLLADGTAHVQRHARGTAVLNDVGQAALVSVLVQVLQLSEIRTED